MAKPTIVTRAGKGSALTWAEGDANSTNLQTAAVPDGGAAGDYLVKNSATNWDFGWTDRVNAKTIFENVKNVSGGSLAKGTPVTQVGVSGNTITVEAARADDPDLLAIGVLDQTLANEAEGRMIVLGEIKGVNTNAFATGDKIYLGATGGYTNVKPTALDVAVQFLGVVNRISSTVGSGFITGTLIEDSVRYTGTDFEFWTGTDWEELPYLSATAPVLEGNLDVGSNSITTSVTNGNITLTPNGTGRVVVSSGVLQAGNVSVATNTSTTSTLAVTQAHSTAAANAIVANRARNTVTSPAAVQTNDELFELRTNGHDGTNYVSAFEITTSALSTPTTGFVPSKTEFKVRTASGTISTVMEVASDASGAVAVNGLMNLGAAALTVEGDAGVDISAPASDVVIQGLTYPDADGTAGQVLVTDGAGVLSFATASGSGITDLVQDTTPQLGGNLDVQSNTITTSVTNGNITIVPNGTGDVNLDADTVRVGDANTNATITTNGTGNLTLSTNNGTNSGTITINQSANSDIIITPNGTGDIDLIADTVQFGDLNTAATLTTNGTGNLVLNTNNGTNSGSITVTQGANANIVLAPNGSGDVHVDADTLRVGDANIDATITTNGTGNLVLSTNNGTNSGTIQINQGANSGIAITPNGTGDVVLQADTIRIGDLNATATITTFGTGDLVLNTGNGATTGLMQIVQGANANINICLLYTSPSPRDRQKSRMPSSA